VPDQRQPQRVRLLQNERAETVIFTIVLMHSATSAELLRERFEGKPERALYRTGYHSERGGVAYATAGGIIRWAFKDGERIKIKRPKRKGK
jgi:hypothetical protein